MNNEVLTMGFEVGSIVYEERNTAYEERNTVYEVCNTAYEVCNTAYEKRNTVYERGNMDYILRLHRFRQILIESGLTQKIQMSHRFTDFFFFNHRTYALFWLKPVFRLFQ